MILAPGTRLGPYQILEPLGSGGMGEVYRARDGRLGRDVAIKVLSQRMAASPEARARFEREARSASALNHPNIITIYEIGQEGATTFIAMEWVEGKTLRERVASGPMPREDLLRIASQIASGLSKAHRAGIVHRDLKPGNIMVTDDGVVKILDFGLAKLAESVAEPPGEEPTRDIASTRAGDLLGTPAYMSPEQASGRPVDFRSDQFSLGLVLYELATGKRAFERSTDLQTIAALLSEEAAPVRSLSPGVPREFEDVVARCLRRKPESRFGDTGELAGELERIRLQYASPGGRPGGAALARWTRGRTIIAAGLALIAVAAVLIVGGRERRRPAPPPTPPAAVPARPTLAVLPFRALTEQSEERELGLGIADAIITGLGGSPDLVVRPTRVVLPYEDKSTDPIEVGKTLHVGAVLDGTLQRSGGRLRIQVQLWQVPDGTSLWTQKYDVTTGDVFSVQDQIGTEVAQALRVRLTAAGRGRLGTPYSSDPNVYALILRARGLELRQGRETLKTAISLYEDALRREPANALAHAWLASACRLYSFHYEPNDPEWLEKAERHAERALELDPNLAEAYAAQASVLWTPQRHFQHDRSMALYRKALELNPNLATDRGFYAVVLSHVGLLDLAAAEAHKALETDPEDVRALAEVAENFSMRGEPRQGEEAARAALDVDPDYSLSRLAIVECLVSEGKLDDAETLLGRNYFGEAPYLSLAFEGLIAARRERFAEAESLGQRAVREGEGRGPYHHATYALAQIEALAGKREASVRWLRRTAEEGMPCYPMFRDDPLLAKLQGDSGYENLLAEMRRDWERRRAESGESVPGPPTTRSASGSR